MARYLYVSFYQYLICQTFAGNKDRRDVLTGCGAKNLDVNGDSVYRYIIRFNPIVHGNSDIHSVIVGAPGNVIKGFSKFKWRVGALLNC